MTDRHAPDRHRRRSIRLKNYDYRQAGAYFVTLCTQDRAPVFGAIVNGTMVLNAAGAMVQEVWDDLPRVYPGVDIDAFVVMPDHVHGIIVLVPGTPAPPHAPRFTHVGAGPRACPGLATAVAHAATPGGRAHAAVGSSPTHDMVPHPGQARGPAPTLSLVDVVHRLESLTTHRYAAGVKRRGWPPFPGRLWQRNYYEHIIRDAAELDHERDYIAANPMRWEEDRLRARSRRCSQRQ